MTVTVNELWRATACDGKQAFKTASAANKVAKLSAGRKSVAMNAYKCSHCKQFHIGNSSGAAKRPAPKTRPPRRLRDAGEDFL